MIAPPAVQSPSARYSALQALFADLGEFSRRCYPGHALRRYQLAAAAPLLAAVTRQQGGAFVLQFSRQAGKDELLAQVQAFLLARYRLAGGQVVMATPTYKPQAEIGLRRLKARLLPALHPGATSQGGYRVACGQAASVFLSAEPAANVRGETASLLLLANEAQDIASAVWDSRFAPMTASTNAPACFSGTPWATGSLLSRETASAPAAHVFKVDWQQVAAELPAYGAHVRGRIAQLGERHPFIRTEYCLEELDAQGGLFDAQRQAQMRGRHTRQATATAGHVYALLLDVAGAAEDAPDDPAARARERRRDATALTVVEVDLATVHDDLVRKPTYRVVDRRLWQGVPHPTLYATLLDLARNVWKVRYFVGDATGIGAGLMAFIEKALAPRVQVLPFVFSYPSKSDLGWAFVGAIESGRYKEYVPDEQPVTRQFWAEVGACTYSVDPTSPGKLMRWSVPESQGHDDLLVSAALVGALDSLDWRPRAAAGRQREDFT